MSISPFSNRSRGGQNHSAYLLTNRSLSMAPHQPSNTCLREPTRVRGCASLLGGGRVSASDASGWCCWAQASPDRLTSRPHGPRRLLSATATLWPSHRQAAGPSGRPAAAPSFLPGQSALDDRSPCLADAQGAVGTLARTRFGGLALAISAVGLVAFAVWQLSAAAVGFRWVCGRERARNGRARSPRQSRCWG
jgi:hypothetical protein